MPCPIPGQAYAIGFSATAESQLAWIAQRSALPLRERIVNTLQLGPQPHPYRRIRRRQDGGLTLAVQDWRVDFIVEGLQVRVLHIRTGYKESQLANPATGPDDPIALHRDYSRR